MTPPSAAEADREAHESDPLLSTYNVDNSNNNNNEEEAENAGEDVEKQTHHPDDDDDDDDDQTAQTAGTTMLEHVAEALEHAVETVEHAVEEVQEAVTEWTEEVQEAVAEEMHEVADIAAHKLHDADEGELTFLDMTITRGLSLLPGELQKVTEILQIKKAEADLSDLEDSERVELVDAIKPASAELEERLEEHRAAVTDELASHKAAAARPPLSAYLGLASAVISLSAIGPLLAVQQHASGLLKIFWRMFGTSCLLLPLAVLDARRDGIPALTGPQWATFALSTVSYLIMACAFVLAIDLTAIGNAVILSNSQAIMLLVGNLFVGNPVNVLEGGGAITAFVGAVLCSKDSADTDTTGENATDAWSSIKGDALALFAGIGGCGYLIFAPSVRQHMPLFLFTFATMFVGCLMCLAFQILVLREHVTFDANPATGIFGFIAPQFDRLPVELVIVIVCNCGGTLGYIRAMQFFEPLIISVAGLMEPVTAEFLSFWFGVSLLPGWMGWLGNLLVACGTLAVVWPTDNKKPMAH